MIKNTAEMFASKTDKPESAELGMAKILRCWVRYFNDGAVIGSKDFVNEAFAGAWERFAEKKRTARDE